jgi:energy-coupling factor transport system substrate-specific component
VLVGGFAWYERSRPPARLVALVAALAALAVAGRLVLAPIPNVVATTDVALLTGYAIGGAPGFVVGALAAPVSNFWLGQGPWTPWQMAGWGLSGLVGAGLAALTDRRLGRLGLACACAAMGFAYGALLDLSVMVTYGGEQSLDRYLAISARGIPFNAAHAAGNFAIALAAGPALIRMLSRFRTRFEVRWLDAAPARAGAAGAASLVLAICIAAAAQPDALEARAAGAPAARAWLERAQSRDGGFGVAPGSPSSAAMTGWTMLGLEAAGRNPLDLERGGSTPVDFLRSRAANLRSTGDIERTILALAGAGVDPRSFGGRDLVGDLRERRSRDGSFEGQVNLTAFGVLALRIAGDAPSDLSRSAGWLRDAANGDGGWGFRPGAGSEADSTGAALQALAAARAGGAAAGDGADYLRQAQGADGGWALAHGGPTNSQSTAWAIQGLIAARVSPAGVSRNGHTPLDYLDGRQGRDGHYRYSRSSDQTPVWVTGQALIAAAGKALPLAAVPRSASSGSPEPAADEGGTASSRADGARGKNGARGRNDGHRGRRGEPADDRKGASAGGGESREGDPATTPLAAGADRHEEGGPATAAYVAGGLGLLAAALTAGFLWYRRTLP